MPTAEPQGCLIILLQIFGMKPAGGQAASSEPLPYSLNKYFFSQAERKFYQVLL